MFLINTELNSMPFSQPPAIFLWFGFVVSHFLQRRCLKQKEKLHDHTIGFKYFCLLVTAFGFVLVIHVDCSFCRGYTLLT